jgi:hypothetical protein
VLEARVASRLARCGGTPNAALEFSGAAFLVDDGDAAS